MCKEYYLEPEIHEFLYRFNFDIIKDALESGVTKCWLLKDIDNNQFGELWIRDGEISICDNSGLLIGSVRVEDNTTVILTISADIINQSSAIEPETTPIKLVCK